MRATKSMVSRRLVNSSSRRIEAIAAISPRREDPSWPGETDLDRLFQGLLADNRNLKYSL